VLLCPRSGRSDPGLAVSSAGEDGSGQAGVIVVDGPTPPTGWGSRRMDPGPIVGCVGNVGVAFVDESRRTSYEMNPQRSQSGKRTEEHEERTARI